MMTGAPLRVQDRQVQHRVPRVRGTGAYPKQGRAEEGMEKQDRGHRNALQEHHRPSRGIEGPPCCQETQTERHAVSQKPASVCEVCRPLKMKRSSQMESPKALESWLVRPVGWSPSRTCRLVDESVPFTTNRIIANLPSSLSARFL